MVHQAVFVRQAELIISVTDSDFAHGCRCPQGKAAQGARTGRLFHIMSCMRSLHCIAVIVASLLLMMSPVHAGQSMSPRSVCPEHLFKEY